MGDDGDHQDILDRMPDRVTDAELQRMRDITGMRSDKRIEKLQVGTTVSV